MMKSLYQLVTKVEVFISVFEVFISVNYVEVFISDSYQLVTKVEVFISVSY